ncbi:MAG: hypothetical protein PGN15_06820 [Aeromicrobium erythreum]
MDQDDRVVLLRAQLLLQRRAGVGGRHAADVDAADGGAGGEPAAGEQVATDVETAEQDGGGDERPAPPVPPGPLVARVAGVAVDVAGRGLVGPAVGVHRVRRGCRGERCVVPRVLDVLDVLGRR